jgi:hypothetical protein
MKSYKIWQIFDFLKDKSTRVVWLERVQFFTNLATNFCVVEEEIRCVGHLIRGWLGPTIEDHRTLVRKVGEFQRGNLGI